jgi:hypothetical protein
MDVFWGKGQPIYYSLRIKTTYSLLCVGNPCILAVDAVVGKDYHILLVNFIQFKE